MITNKYNLPQSLVSAVENDPYYNAADISTTTVIKPYQMVALQSRIGNISEDAVDCIYRLIGTNTHSIIERVKLPGAIKEWRFYYSIKGWLLSGQIDLYENGVLSDWKVTSVWSVINGLKTEHIQQMNINAFLIRHSPYADLMPIKKLQIVNLLRDWSKYKAKESRDYPKVQVLIQDVPMFSDKTVYDFLITRIAKHQECREMASNELPECTDDERWAEPTKYAIMKKGRKRALKLCGSKKEAETIMKEKGFTKLKYYIQIREGKPKRCLDYCSVSEYCHQYGGKNENN